MHMNNFINYEQVANIDVMPTIEAQANMLQLTADKDVDFVQIVCGIQKVRQAVCYVTNSGEVLCGVLTEPLFSLSERLNLQRDIQKKLSELTGQQAYVSLDTDVFALISECKNEQQAKSIKQLIIMRNNAR